MKYGKICCASSAVTYIFNRHVDPIDVAYCDVEHSLRATDPAQCRRRAGASLLQRRVATSYERDPALRLRYDGSVVEKKNPFTEHYGRVLLRSGRVCDSS